MASFVLSLQSKVMLQIEDYTRYLEVYAEPDVASPFRE